MMAPLSWHHQRLLPAITILPVWCHRVFAPFLALFLPLSRKPLTHFVSTDFDFFRSFPLFCRSSWPLLNRCIYLAVCIESVWIGGSLVFLLSCFVTRIKHNFAQTPFSPQINNSLPSLFSPPLHSPSIWTKVSDGRCICFTNSNILVLKKKFLLWVEPEKMRYFSGLSHGLTRKTNLPTIGSEERNIFSSEPCPQCGASIQNGHKGETTQPFAVCQDCCNN